MKPSPDAQTNANPTETNSLKGIYFFISFPLFLSLFIKDLNMYVYVINPYFDIFCSDYSTVWDRVKGSYSHATDNSQHRDYINENKESW